MQQGVSNEDELITHVMKGQYWSGFSKINRISTIKISPDIDFLQIDKIRKKAVGYEFKLIKYNKGWKRANLTPMYTGLGEALHYFHFGVDKSYLVLGLSNTIPSNALDIALEKVVELLSTLNTFRALGLKCFGVYIWNERNNSFKQLINASEDFPMSKDEKHRKECLLRLEFKYDKKFEKGLHIGK